MVENIIVGLDIGSSTIRAVVGQVAKNNDTEQLNIIGVVEVPALGMNKGSVVSLEDTVSSISACIEKAERMIGLEIQSVWVGISGTHISSQESKGVIAIARTNGEIQENDIQRVIETAKAVAAPVNYEVLHVIPKTFSIDNQTRDPLGMSGIRLEVSTQVVRGLSSQIKNLTKSIHRTGIDINDLILSSLAASDAVLSVRQKELGVALVDIGAATTKVIVFEESDVIQVSVFPIGSDNITSDLAICLQTSLDVAERIKLDIGGLSSNDPETEDEINLRDFGGEDQVFSKKHILEIITARTEEIFQKVDEELQKINRSGLLPAGLILIGGGSKLAGLVEVAKKKTMLPVSVGTNKRFNTAVDKVNDISFTTALGLVMWGFGSLSEKGTRGPLRFIPSVSEGIKVVRGWFKHLIS